MKTAKEWLKEMQAECSAGEPATPMLDRIEQIQHDVQDSMRGFVSPEKVKALVDALKVIHSTAPYHSSVAKWLTPLVEKALSGWDSAKKDL